MRRKNEQIQRTLGICQNSGKQSLKLTFYEIQNIAGVPIDYSFLNFKKELTNYGYQVGKISMKEKSVSFEKKKMRYFYDDVKGTIEIMDKDAIFNKSFSTIDCIKMIKDLYGIDLDEDYNKEE